MFAGQFFGKVVINWFYYIILNKYGEIPPNDHFFRFLPVNQQLVVKFSPLSLYSHRAVSFFAYLLFFVVRQVGTTGGGRKFFFFFAKLEK